MPKTSAASASTSETVCGSAPQRGSALCRRSLPLGARGPAVMYAVRNGCEGSGKASQKALDRHSQALTVASSVVTHSLPQIQNPQLPSRVQREKGCRQ